MKKDESETSRREFRVSETSWKIKQWESMNLRWGLLTGCKAKVSVTIYMCVHDYRTKYWKQKRICYNVLEKKIKFMWMIHSFGIFHKENWIWIFLYCSVGWYCCWILESVDFEFWHDLTELFFVRCDRPESRRKNMERCLLQDRMSYWTPNSETWVLHVMNTCTVIQRAFVVWFFYLIFYITEAENSFRFR